MSEWNDAAKQRMAELGLIYQLTQGKGVTEDQKKEMRYLHEIEHADDLKRFGDTLDWLTQRIYFHDPIGLVPCEIPQNEYDCEARMILRDLAIRGRPGLTEVLEVVHEVFVIQFGLPSCGSTDRQCYIDIAKELVECTDDWCGK